MDDDVMNLIETEIFDFQSGHQFRTLPVNYLDNQPVILIQLNSKQNLGL